MSKSTTSLPRKERRKLEQIRGKQERKAKRTASSNPQKNQLLQPALLTVAIALAVVATVATTVIASVKSNSAPEPHAPRALIKAIQDPVTGPSIVQICMNAEPVGKPEMIQVAKSTADWWRGKANHAETEMWVAPDFEFVEARHRNLVAAKDLKVGDLLETRAGGTNRCAAVYLRQIVPDEEYVALYLSIHPDAASIPVGAPGMYISRVTQRFKREVDEVAQIYYGDLSLPADLSPVTMTNADLIEVSRQANSDSGGSVFVTEEHPYYVVNKSRFVSVKDLEKGDRLRDKDGKELVFHGKRRILSKPGDPFTVYNFEVANQHTYFAGKEGVWVHNLCKPALDNYALRFEASLKAKGSGASAWAEALEEVLDGALVSDKLSYDELAEVGGFLLSKSGGRVDEAVLAQRWERAVNELSLTRKIDDPTLPRYNGTAFDNLRDPYYISKDGVNQVTLSNGKRLDSYIPGEEIVSRKYKQYATRSQTDFAGDLDELITSYKDGVFEIVGGNSEKNPGLDALIGTRLNAEHYILEVPIQHSPIPAGWVDEAVSRGVIVRDVAGNVLISP